MEQNRRDYIYIAFSTAAVKLMAVARNGKINVMYMRIIRIIDTKKKLVLLRIFFLNFI